MINTPIAKLPKPQLTDVANIETSTHPYSNLADTMMVPRYATLGDRNTAITSPTSGMLCWVTATGELYKYSGGFWISAIPRFIRKTSNSQVVNNSTTFVDDSAITFSVEANSSYCLELTFGFDSTSTADIKTRWSIPSGATCWASFISQDGNVPSEGAVYGQYPFDGTSSIVHAYSGISITTGVQERTYLRTVSSGTMKFQWAQSIAQAINTLIQTNACILIWKVA